MKICFLLFLVLVPSVLMAPRPRPNWLAFAREVYNDAREVYRDYRDVRQANRNARHGANFYQANRNVRGNQDAARHGANFYVTRAYGGVRLVPGGLALWGEIHEPNGNWMLVTPL